MRRVTCRSCRAEPVYFCMACGRFPAVWRRTKCLIPTQYPIAHFCDACKNTSPDKRGELACPIERDCPDCDGDGYVFVPDGPGSRYLTL